MSKNIIKNQCRLPMLKKQLINRPVPTGHDLQTVAGMDLNSSRVAVTNLSPRKSFGSVPRKLARTLDLTFWPSTLNRNRKPCMIKSSSGPMVGCEDILRQ